MRKIQIEIRDMDVLVRGYVNCVDRDSKQMQFKDINNGEPFVEQVVDGTFKRAIEQNDDIKILLNHDRNYCLGSTQNNLKLKEDNIGLYAEFRTADADTIQKAKDNKIVGWSFGFNKAKDSWGKTDSDIARRYLHEFDLVEVSLLDNTRVPAYSGCSVETRSETEEIIEYRCTDNTVESNVEEIEKREMETKLKLLKLELEL